MAKAKKNTYRLTFTMGEKRAQFMAHTQAEAASIRLHVKRLISSKRTGAPCLESEEWAQTRPKGALRDFLIRWGLLEDTSERERTINDLYEHFQKRGVKSSTLGTYTDAFNNLFDFYGAEKLLRDITPKDATEFEVFLRTAARRMNGKGGKQGAPIGSGLSKPTVKKRIERVRQFFLEARRLHWISENPFEAVHGGNVTNPEKWLYIPRETVLEVMGNTPNLETRAKIALCRFAGARGASEFDSLEWNPEWIQWSADGKQGTIRLHRTKTEDSGFSDTIVPMIPELENALRDLFDNAAAGTVKVFHTRSNPGKIIKEQFQKNGIDIKTPYNLRRSYCRDLMEAGLDPKSYEYFAGHSLRVALKHYQQWDELRAKKAAPRVLEALQGAEKASTQFDTQQVHNLVHGNNSQTLASDGEKSGLSLENRDSCKKEKSPCENLQGLEIGATRFERATSTSRT